MGESDADRSGDVNDRESTTGYYFKLNGCGAALSWGVKKQVTVALTSSEAEYQGMTAAFQGALYMKLFWRYMKCSGGSRSIVYETVLEVFEMF